MTNEKSLKNSRENATSRSSPNMKRQMDRMQNIRK